MIRRVLNTLCLSLDRFVVRDLFAGVFPKAEFDHYEAFVRDGGACLKSEPRTQVRLIEGTGAAASKARFIVKEYYYPLLPRTRTWLRHSKAEHEFRTLLEVQRLGIAAAEPVAFGVRRTLAGFVRSCFIITRYVEDSCTLEQWMKPGDELGKTQAERDWPVCDAIGRTFRKLHQGSLYLFTAKPRNILVRRTGHVPELILIDVPYALHIPKQPFARWAQAVDLAVFLGNIARVSPEDSQASFYRTYLPDPLGASRGEMERRVHAAIRWRRNETPVSSLVHTVRGAARKWQRQRRKRDLGFLYRSKSFLVLGNLSAFLDCGELQPAMSVLGTVL